MATAVDPEQDIQVAAAVLSNRYEQQLFHGATQGRVVPALVITGFLGAGKTTLLQHLLHSCSSYLRLGVLVNEVAHLDVDSQLLNTQQSNAAAGIRAAQLAGGCACCAVSSDLAAALAELAGSSNYQQLDYLLLETSGVADAEPLAVSLSRAGFRLTAVVAVLDAEAGLEVLQQPVALAQLCAADVVVLNKCDLATLGIIASVEDRVQELAPGVRMLRARYGQVPAEALLDIDPPTEEEQQQQAGAGTGAREAGSQQLPAAQGEIAFLSHEPVVSSSSSAGRRRAQQRAEPVVTRRAKAAGQQQVSSANSAGQQNQPPPQDHHHHHHQHPDSGHHSSGGTSASNGGSNSHTHSSFGSVSFISEQPLCMACFQSYAANQLITSPGLFRAKGFAWFAQQRSERYTFHLSGKQRAECGAEGCWEGPAAVQLVLIGQQQQQQLQQLKLGLQDCLYGICICSTSSQPADCHREKQLQLQEAGQERQGCVGETAPPPPPSPAACSNNASASAAALAKVIQQHHRFELVPNQQQQEQQEQQQQQQVDGVVGSLSCLVQFSAIGSALHGVVADEVNAAVLRKANATPGIFLCHIKSPAKLAAASSSSAQVAYQGVKALQLCCSATASPADVLELWQRLEAAVAPVLRKAYQHVHSCKCDVAEALQVMGE